MPQINTIGLEDAERGVVVIGVNYKESLSIVQNYQNMYPGILMLMDPAGAHYSLYRYNGYIPLNYVIGHDIQQTVDYRMEGYSHGTITSRINALMSDVTVTLVPDSAIFQRGGNLGFDLEYTNWSNSTKNVATLLDVELPSENYRDLETSQVSLNAGQTIVLRQDLHIPGQAPLGDTYRMRSLLGKAPNDLWNGDSFHFEITP